MRKQDFIKWLDTLIDAGDADWVIEEDRDLDGNVIVSFQYIEDDLNEEKTK